MCGYKEQCVVELLSERFPYLFILVTTMLQLVLNGKICRCACNSVILGPSLYMEEAHLPTLISVSAGDTV